MTKVQLTLTDQEAAILAGYGDKFGYNLTKVSKFFLSKAAEKILHTNIMPVYPMSETTEKKGLIALEEFRQGKTIEVQDIEGYFDNL